ncbi:MAG: hypothetical protein ACKVU2_14755 [Saprospiraceae bacterium]
MLILLADTRKKLLWLWLGFTAGLVLLALVQTLSGKFELIETQAWTWLFVQVLPGMLLLLAAVLMNKNPSKVLLRATFRAVYVGTLAYLLLVTLTFFALPMAVANWSIEEYLGKSNTWLLPFQAVLLLAFVQMYFRKEPLLRPNPAIMQQYVAKKAEFAQRTGNVARAQAFDLLVSDGGLGAALEFLRDHEKTDTNSVVMLQSQYAEWVKQRDLNLLPPDALQRELNRLTMAAIGFAEKI